MAGRLSDPTPDHPTGTDLRPPASIYVDLALLFPGWHFHRFCHAPASKYHAKNLKNALAWFGHNLYWHRLEYARFLVSLAYFPAWRGDQLYETVVYVALIVAALLGWLDRYATNNRCTPLAGGFGAGLCAFVGQIMPPDLGAHISPLQPVLRSQFWLWVRENHRCQLWSVPLAWAMANIVLLNAAWRRQPVPAAVGQLIYRVLQVGVVLIIAGTLLGAVWADQAWGRFWGWDPKEVWALVVILIYLIPLHLRLVGRVRATGLAAWSIYGFGSVHL